MVAEFYGADARWTFFDAAEAVQCLIRVYEVNTAYVREHYIRFCRGEEIEQKIEACYPEIRFHLEKIDSISPALSHGFLEQPGYYATSVTQPALFADYLCEQIGLIIKNHQIPVEIGVSSLPIPVKFVAGYDDISIENLNQARIADLHRLFSTIDLDVIDDGVADGVTGKLPSGAWPLSLFTAPRVDIALQRLEHYTGCKAEDFQDFILLTNYAFHMEYFLKFACHNLELAEFADIPTSAQSYDKLVAPGADLSKGEKLTDIKELSALFLRRCLSYQMPAFHLKVKDRDNQDGHGENRWPSARKGRGITIVNIGVGPSNAKTMTDCLAVLRPHCWLMVGHCAGLDGRMKIGDMIVANSFERQDRILDRHVPLARPVPGLSEVQLALEKACRKTRRAPLQESKPDNVRTGTVLSVDDRNWEWRTTAQIRADLHGSTSIALDMETATIATNGYRFRVPYGSLLSVSDKPLHNEPKLPRAARNFYHSSGAEHILTAIYGLEGMMEAPGSLHSRKLRRAVGEVAFR